MSLILEALKKVERERTAPEQRGFLVLGPAAWAPARSNAGWILGIVAAAALAGGVVYLLTRPERAAERAVSPAAGTPAESRPPSETVAAPAAEAATWEPLPPATVAPRARSNAPGSQPAAPGQSAPALVLHAISEQDGVPVAVINDRVVREGQSFDGIRIVRIGAAEVEIEAGGVRRMLRF